MDLHQIDWENIPWEPVREGITRKAFSGNGATVALHKLMPKHEPKPHAHSYEQIVYIIAGRIRFHVGEKSVMLGPGGLLQIPPDVVHWHGAAPDRLFAHLAMSENSDSGAGTAWGEHVTDAEYAQAVT